MDNQQTISPESEYSAHTKADSENKYRLIAENTADYLAMMDFHGIYTYISPSHRKLGYSQEVLLGKSGFDLIHPEDRKQLLPLFVKYTGMKITELPGLKKDTCSKAIEFRFPDTDGNWHYMETTASLVDSLKGTGLNILLVSRDVTKHKKDEEEILRLNRLYKVISYVNQAVVRATTREELLETVCRVIVEQGGFRLVWVGQIDTEGKKVMPVAEAGPARELLHNIIVFTDGGRPEGRGPTGTCIRELKPFVQNDFINDPNALPWQKKAKPLGLRGAAAFPISVGGQVWGALTVYSDTVGYFGPRETRLLEEAAGDIGFALDNIEKERRRVHAEAAAKLNEARLESLLKISEYKASSIQSLLDFTLDQAIKLTSSKIGYIYHYDEDRHEFALNSWSNTAMKECSVVDAQTIYQLERTGIWGEAVRQRRAILINDFQASNPLKKGYPEGHVKLLRFLTVPVIIQDRIVATVAVANKETDYTPADIRQLSLLMDSVWKVVDRMNTESQIKASLVEKELLLKEIHHRVKNNMQVISSLLELQSGFVKVKEDATLFHESQQRINSMALVYNKLYQSKDLANISFAEYVTNLVANLINSYALNPQRITTRIDIKNIELGIDLAIPCGLIINEAVTNSLKYAFPQNRNGEIWVIVQQNAGLIEMSIGDNGIGISQDIDLTTIKTLGMMIIQTLVVQQLGGKIELKKAHGTEYSIKFRPVNN